MSVRQSLLAILDQGPCYGYQLRAEFDRRTGATWPLNVGQIYNTLERLERDGLVEKDGVDEQGHVYWRITDAGTADVRAWWTAPVERTGVRDELAIKLAVAATLPGVDVAEVIRAQQTSSQAALEVLRGRRDAGASGDAADPIDPEILARSLIHDAQVFAAEAEVRWLGHVAERLAAQPRHAFALALASEKPRRGRPRAARTLGA